MPRSCSKGGISESVAVPPLGAAIVLAALAFIGLMTLAPTPESAELAAKTPVWCLVCGDHGAIDVTMNVLLFIPLGVGFCLIRWPLPRTVGTILLLSLVIELLQMTAIPGRDASLSDLLTNTSGAAIGHWLAQHHRVWLLPTPLVSKRLFLISSGTWLAVTLMTAYGVAPARSDRPLHGQIAAQLGHLENFPGQVLTAKAASRPMPNGRYASSDYIRAALNRAEADLYAEVITGDPPEGLAPIVSLADDRATILLLLGQDEDALVYNGRIRASRARFRSPSIALPDVFPSDDQTELHIGGLLSRQAISVWVTKGGERHGMALSLSPNWTWVLIFPFDFTLGTGAPVFTGLWLLLILLPGGFWAGRAAKFPWTIIIASVLLALWVIPLLFGLNPVAWQEWAGATLGIASGTAIGKLSLNRQNVA